MLTRYFRSTTSATLDDKYASQYRGSMVVVLEPDVAAVFPSAGEANEALRALAGIIQKHRPIERYLAGVPNRRTHGPIKRRSTVEDTAKITRVAIFQKSLALWGESGVQLAVALGLRGCSY